MDYVTQYYKNLSEQLQQRVNFLNKKVKYLTEAEATPGPTDGGKGGQSPFAPGGYFYPSQLNPPQFTPNPKPYRNPGPIKPGDYSPYMPESLQEWLRENPRPNFEDYPPGSPEFERLYDIWYQKYVQFLNDYFRRFSIPSFEP